MPQEQIGAVPQQQVMNKPMMNNPRTPKLSPDQIMILRKDPEITQAITKFMGRPVPMEKVPDELLVEIAGMVHKLGVDGAIAKFQQMVPPQVLQQLKQGMGQTQQTPMPPQSQGPNGNPAQ